MMFVRRNRRTLRALWLLAILSFSKYTVCYPAEGEALPLNAAPAESEPASRRTPFYEEEPVVSERESRAEQVTPLRMKSQSKTTKTTPRRSMEEVLSEPGPGAVAQKTPLPETTYSDDAAIVASPHGRSGFGSSVIWAVGILAVGWIARLFMKPGGPLSMAAPSAIELLSKQTIGPQQQIAIVRFGRRLLLVGTTPTGMTTLATVDDPAEVQSIVAELQTSPTSAGPTLTDLFRSKQADSKHAGSRRTASPSVEVTLSTESRVASHERHASSLSQREVTDV